MFIKNNKSYWFIFGHSSTAQCYQFSDEAVVPITNFVDSFPEFASKNLFGSMIRLDQLEMEGLHFVLFGFDTGYLVATVCETATSKLLDRLVSLNLINYVQFRKLIKYNTPISVAMFIDFDCLNSEIYTVISSTIGPAAVWELKFDHAVRIFPFI